MAVIRAATPDDADPIARIWNRVIRETSATFTTAEKEPTTLATGIADGVPFHVAESGGRVTGFVTAVQFRGGPGYVHTWEHSIHIDASAQGQGLGSGLMDAIETDLRARGGHSVFAGISGENVAGLRFHQRLGYAEVARLPEVGRKFDRWHDLVLMQKFL